MYTKLAIALYCAVCGAASAQGVQPPAAADPAASAAAPKYESAFSAYRPYQEQSPGAWRELNEEVAKAGGHVGIFGGAGHPGHGAEKPPAPAPKSPAQGSEAAGPPPVRSAPAAPGGKPHH